MYLFPATDYCLKPRLRKFLRHLQQTALFPLHKFTIGQLDKPECMCHFKEESPKHFFLDCFLYTTERQTLFSLVEHYIPKFQRLSNSEKFNILMNGLKPENPDYDYLNMKITIALQLFIIKSKRFENHI